MTKRVVILALACLLAMPALSLAKDMTGKWGLGYFSSDAPVGARFWTGPKLGIDVGVGFESMDLGDETASNFYIEAGLPYVVFPSERANFFVRPGVLFASFDELASTTKSVIQITLAPGAEVFFGEHFSLEAAHGIAIQISSPHDDNLDSSTDFGTFGASVTTLGFHFYFK